MRRSPLIVPDAADRASYLVLDDFGSIGARGGRPTRRAPIAQRSLPTYSTANIPVLCSIVACNPEWGWCRDVSEDVADEIVEAALARNALCRHR